MIINPLERRNLGRTGISVSAISFGCWGLIDGWGQKFDITTIKRILELSWELGINLYDTASVYGKGLGEEVFRNFEWSKRAIIATKVSAQEKPTQPIKPIADYYNKSYIERVVNDSLKRLDRDYIDILQLHNWFIEWDKEYDYIIDILQTYKNMGKVRAIGISIPRETLLTSSLPFLKYIDTVQIPVNVFDRAVIERIYKLKIASQTNILARSILHQGIISRVANKSIGSDISDAQKMLYSDIELATLNNNINNVCNLTGITPEAIPYYAIAYIITNKAITSAIIGIRQVQHLVKNTDLSNYRFSPEQIHMGDML